MQCCEIVHLLPHCWSVTTLLEWVNEYAV